MYSLVLMAAMSSAPEAPQFNGFFRDFFNRQSCSGCSGCTGCTGCTGSDSRSRSNDDSSCHGSCHGIFGGRIRSFFSQGGCCSGSSCHGDHRDRGAMPREADNRVRSGNCQGNAYVDRGSSCCGGGYAMVSLPQASCYGLGLGTMTPSYPGFPEMSVPSLPPGGYAMPGAAPAYYGGMPMEYGNSTGCFGSGGTMLGSTIPYEGSTFPGGSTIPYTGPSTGPGGDYPTISPPGLPMTPPSTMPFDRPATPTPAPPPTVSEERSLRGSHQNVVTVGGNNRATIQVRIPTGAKLYAEGQLLTVTNGEKTFTTPPLIADREAVYSFRVVYARDGQEVSLSKKVSVRAGSKATVAFDDVLTKSTPTITPPSDMYASNQVSAQKPTVGEGRAKISVKLPAGAILYVDGRKSERKDLVREFNTPVLEAGKDYAYVMRVENPLEGKAGDQELKIEFSAGMALVVDFTNKANPVRTETNLARK